MTAPAEDPRGGEPPDLMAALRRSLERPPPAAGRGDTDSSGEYACVVCGYQLAEHQGDGEMVHDFRPAGDRAQPTEELRDQILLHLQHRYAPPGPFGFAARDWLIEANDLLALPAVAALLREAEAWRATAAVIDDGIAAIAEGNDRALDGA